MGVYKQKGCVEDLELGLGTVKQTRNGIELVLTRLNASHLLTSDGGNLDELLLLLDDHLGDINNPHQVNKAQIGLSEVDNTSDMDKPISTATQIELVNKLGVNDKATDSNRLNGYIHENLPLSVPALAYIDGQDFLSFLKTEHVVISSGAVDAGKPILLDSSGRLDPTVAGSGLVFQAMFTPTSGSEYPVTDPNTLPGYYWGIIGVDGTTGYTFTGGDLAGEVIYNNDALVFGAQGWGIYRVSIMPDDYYKLDGSLALTADFSGGGYKITNIIDGTEITDGATVAQVNSKVSRTGDTMTGSLTFTGGTSPRNIFMATDYAQPNAQIGQWMASDGSYHLQYLDDNDVQDLLMIDVNGYASIYKPPTNADHIVNKAYADTFEPGLGLGTAEQILAVNAAGDGKEWIDNEGGAINDMFYENSIVVTENYTITAGKNAMTAGPITVADGITVTVPNGSTWTVV